MMPARSPRPISPWMITLVSNGESTSICSAGLNGSGTQASMSAAEAAADSCVVSSSTAAEPFSGASGRLPSSASALVAAALASIAALNSVSIAANTAPTIAALRSPVVWPLIA
ncbi:hypothetical protein D3C80_1674250 [compost metagenome]